jgi:hypothetical protein
MKGLRFALAVALTAPLIADGVTAAAIPIAAPRVVACAAGTGPESLTRRFASGIGPMVGADYQRAFPLPDGRRLWLFQDAFVRTTSGATRLVHNVGLVQSGSCFALLRAGTAARPRPWIGARMTTPRRHWFWPLGGTVAADGTFRLFVAEMVERGPGYLTRTEPVATWIATITLPDLRVVRLRRAPDPSAQLYGWSVVDRGAFTYLYGHCYRQFGWSFLGHAPCARNVKVARVPRGRLDASPTYWTGARWSRRAGRAVNVAPRVGPRGEPRQVNPMQISFVGGRWIAVTKVDDWFGDSIYLDHARSPAGPWRTSRVIRAPTLGPSSAYNTYFASFITRTSTSLTIGLSNNRWDGTLSSAYRPTFLNVSVDDW